MMAAGVLSRLRDAIGGLLVSVVVFLAVGCGGPSITETWAHVQ